MSFKPEMQMTAFVSLSLHTFGSSYSIAILPHMCTIYVHKYIVGYTVEL